jgi:hypothetical protein
MTLSKSTHNKQSNMIRLRLLQAFIFAAVILVSQEAFALATLHHLYNASRRMYEAVGAPLYGVLIQGPKNVKTAYMDEAWHQEKPEKRGKFKYKVFGVLRSPGEEAKGIIKGVTDSVSSLGKVCWELISIVFGD